MRSFHRLLLVLALAALVALDGGCGGSSNAPANGADVDAAPADAGADALVFPDASPRCDPQFDPAGPACVPRFDACGPNDVARLGGGCATIGVPPDACAKGFVADGKGGCTPTLPAAACAPGTFAVPGETSCHDVAPCGAPPFGDVPAGAGTLYVDRSFVGAGSDGSLARPFPTVAAAIAAAPTATASTIAIAAGTYLEALTLDRPVRLWGRCPSMVELRAPTTLGTDKPSVRITAPGVELHRLAVVSGQRAVQVDGVAGALVEATWIHDSAIIALGLYDGAEATVRGSLFEKNGYYTVGVRGSTLVVEGSSVRDGYSSGGSSGVGLAAYPDPTSGALATLTVRGSVVERNEESGVVGFDSTLLVEGSVVRDQKPRADGTFGIGIDAAPVPGSKALGSTCTVRGSFVSGNTQYGILARGSTLHVETTVVRDGRARPSDGTYGRGIGVLQEASGPPATLTLRDSLVTGNRESALDVIWGTHATIERTILRDTTIVGAAGLGLYAPRLLPRKEGLPLGPAPTTAMTDCRVEANLAGGVVSEGDLTMTGCLVIGNGGAGVVVRGATGALDQVVVRDTGPHGVSRVDGHGIIVDTEIALAPLFRAPASMNVTRSLVERSHTAGLAAFGGVLVADQVAVRDTLPEEATGRSGIGVYALHDTPDDPASLTLTRLAVERNSAAGIAGMGTDVTVTDSWVHDTRPYGDGTLGDGITGIAVTLAGTGTVGGALHLDGVLLEKNARAGVTLFGAKLDLKRSVVRCQTFDVDGEPQPDDGHPPQPFSILDGGGNVCGCDAPTECAASSANLAPIPPPGTSSH